MKISKRQQDIYEFIKSEVKEKGYPPSVREIGEAVGLASSSTVHGHLARLEGKGLIRRDPTKPRAIEILSLEDEAETPNVVNIPIIGKVTAGMPITAIENIDEYFPLPEYMATGETNVFMLEIDGEIVVAMTDENEATCKRFYKEANHFRLQPENDALEPILLNNVTILGKVIGLYRDIR
ncbi:repressor LexA [Listeria monocytogenes]|nr:repressor LexA [Listeria monocytogenes]